MIHRRSILMPVTVTVNDATSHHGDVTVLWSGCQWMQNFLQCHRISFLLHPDDTVAQWYISTGFFWLKCTSAILRRHNDRSIRRYRCTVIHVQWHMCPVIKVSNDASLQWHGCLMIYMHSETKVQLYWCPVRLFSNTSVQWHTFPLM